MANEVNEPATGERAVFEQGGYLQRVLLSNEDGTTATIVGGGGGGAVTGNVASGVADSGNPVKIGGKYNAVAPTFADGQRADIQTDAAGNLKVNIAAGGATGGGPATAAAGAYVDGSIVAIGAKADPKATDTSSAWTLVSVLKGVLDALGFTGDLATTNSAIGLLKAIKASVAGALNIRALASGTDSVTVAGSVSVSALPALPAGSAAIGTVGVTALPALPAGANAIGSVSVNAALPAGANALGTVGVTALPALPTGANTIGTVGVNNFPATQAVSGTVSANATLQAGSAIAGKFGIDQTTPGTTNAVQVIAALPAGTNIVGKLGIDQTTPGTTNAVQVTGAVPLPTGAAQDGTDSTDPSAVQATSGVGLRGWVSTLVSLFRAGTAIVQVKSVAGSPLNALAQLQDGFGNLLRAVSITNGINMLQANTTEAKNYVNASGTLTSTTYADFLCNNYREIVIDLNLTTMTTATLQLTVNRKGSDGIYYQLAQTASLTATGKTSLEVGPGLANAKSLGGNAVQIVTVITGTAVGTISAYVRT